MKVQISIDDELMKRIDQYADDNYMSRSGFLTVAANSYLTQAELSGAICDIAVSVRKIADTGKLNHEDLERLEDFERIARMVVGK